MHVALSSGSVLVPAGYVVLFAVLIAPGYAVAQIVVRRCGFDPAATLAIAYTLTALAGYAAFWCYLASPALGRAVTAAWVLAAVAAPVAVLRTGIRRDAAMQLLLTFAVGLFYLAVLYLPATGIGAEQRFFVLRPSDNVLPQLFAERIYTGQDPRVPLAGWQSSDRPPLQTGIQLLVRPLFHVAPAHLRAEYEIVGLIAQLLWLPAAWLLCVRAGMSSRRFVLALAIFSGFFLYNTVYTWPKLLAAGFCVAALVFALPAQRENRAASLTLAGICAALALLAHGSSAFFVLPAVALVIAFRRPPARTLVAALAAGVLLLIPWSAYQRFYDPPGDRLLKMHLAGTKGVDPRPAAAVIAEAYARTPLDDIVRNKLANVTTAVGAAPLLGSAGTSEPATQVNLWRLRERESVTAALGVVNLGWLVLPWWWWRRSTAGALRRNIGGLLALALASAAFWCAAMWGPAATVTTHAAYALELVLFVALGAVLGDLPRAAAAAVLALAVADLLVTWIAGSLADAWRVAPSLDPLMMLIAIAAGVTAGIVLTFDERAGPSKGSALSAP